MRIAEVPSEDFYKHVGHHLEQLALFALPSQIKEASHTSSNRAIASRLTLETKSQASSLASNSFHGDKSSEVFQSIAKGDMERLKQLLSTGASVFAQYPQFGGILQVAAAFESFEALPLLLERGADPNVQGGEYGSALQAVAAHSGPRLDALRLLIAHGADVNASGGKFGHALIAAAATESLPGNPEDESTSEIIRGLLLHGSDVNAWGSNHGTALHVSLARRDMDSALLLVHMGADPFVQMGKFETPLDIACRNGDRAFIQYTKGFLNANPHLFPLDTPHGGNNNFALLQRYIAERRKRKAWEIAPQLAYRHAAAVATKTEVEKPYNALVEKTGANEARAVKEEVKTEHKAATEKAAAEGQRPLKLSDPIGRKFSFPFHLCNTWSVSHPSHNN
jgi:ankyrin repeat protein